MTNCEQLETYTENPLPARTFDRASNRTTLLVTPRGDERLYGGKVHHTYTFALAIALAEPGVTIKLLPGNYYRAVALVGQRRTSRAPIIIEGTVDGDGTLKSDICGTNAARAIYPDLPDRTDYAFIQLRACEHIRVKDFKVEGVCNQDFGFEDPLKGDFRLRKKSPLLGGRHRVHPAAGYRSSAGLGPLAELDGRWKAEYRCLPGQRYDRGATLHPDGRRFGMRGYDLSAMASFSDADMLIRCVGTFSARRVSPGRCVRGRR